MRTIREQDPYNAGTPMSALGAARTPRDLFYVRSHFPVPDLDLESWSLRVEGTAGTALNLTLDELRAMPTRTLRVTMECAGNGRNLMDPQPGGTPWGLDAVSVADFTGTPLRQVLDRVEVDRDAVEILCTGADRGEVEGEGIESFARGLPVEVARDSDTLLAWEMNGEPLPPRHGRPLRLVVPGWYAMASVKWLVRIAAVREPFEGHFQVGRYVYLDEEGTPHRAPCTTMRVRALILAPEDGAALVPGDAVPVEGIAWSGDGPVEKVEVSVDGGEGWDEAEFGPSRGIHAPVPWRFVWRPPGPGDWTLMARATDASGAVQPLTSRWNRLGYGNNVAHRVRVTV